MSCLFCNIVAERAEASIVHRDELCTAFMDIHPINPGHLLVIPNVHATGLSDLPSTTCGRIFQVGQSLAGALRRSGIPCEGINFVVADGKVAGQTVLHVHLHVLPRFTGDGFGFRHAIDFANPPPRALLNAHAETLRQVLPAV